MTKQKFAPLLISAALVGGLLASSATSILAADKVIKIGGLFPMSGPGSYFGVQDKQGVELALEQLNKSGVNGYKFEVQYEDSACSPLPATQAAKRLLDQFKPDVVIGEECSDATLAVMPIMDQAKVPLLNAGSSSIKITEPGNPWTFRIMPNEVMQGVDIATKAYKQFNARTAVLLHENTNAGIGNANVFAETFTKLGGKILADIGFGRDVNDFTSIATRVAGLGKVDVIPTYTLEGQGLKITQALAQAGVVKGGGGQCHTARHHLAAVRLRAKGRKGGGGLYPHRSVRPDRPTRRRPQFHCGVQSQIQRGSDPPQCPCLRPDHADRGRGATRRQGRPVHPRRACCDQGLLRRDRQRRIRQDQPEHQNGYDPLHGDSSQTCPGRP